MALHDYLTGEVAQDFADGLMSRTEATRRLALLGLGGAAAASLLASCGSGADNSGRDAGPRATPSRTAATATPVPASELQRFDGPQGTLLAAWSPPTGRPRGAVLVVHENRGLTSHFVDVLGRLSGQGYAALCVDLLSRGGGTAALVDPAQAPARLSAAPAEQLVADLRAGLDELQRRAPGAALAAMGFCFGGGMVWQLLEAKEARLAAAVPFYGPAPQTPDFRGTRAAVLAIYAGLDSRVNASRERAEAALKAAGLTYRVKTYPGADHAFFNDTGPRYNATAAAQAWTDVRDWLRRYLG